MNVVSEGLSCEEIGNGKVAIIDCRTSPQCS